MLLPRVSAHVLASAGAAQAPPHAFDYEGCPRVPGGHSARFGGGGEETDLIAGHFTMGGARRNVLLDTLPPAIHVPAAAHGRHPQLAGVVGLILGESAQPGPGSPIVLGRLADLLFVHAIRYWITAGGASSCGMRAVADPAIGATLRLMHGRFAEPWTLERLASSVAMSRSAFAARFTELVGEPPMQYLAEWRMTRAGRLLREGMSVAGVAQQVGYANPAAFSKAFARVQGMAPAPGAAPPPAERHADDPESGEKQHLYGYRGTESYIRQRNQADNSARFLCLTLFLCTTILFRSGVLRGGAWMKTNEAAGRVPADPATAQ